ncbi:tetratricopeptide repeat protein [Bacillus sp. 1P02SD]|uniref:tetratricopeptide repeat protein n=1 Tax=Bacillus sp. 1P02SD TaxID=3132264 RepID=UPI0039A0CB81
MSNVQQQKANMLRKEGKLREALDVYQDLWKNTSRDKYIAAGYLHCLRKLNMHEVALSLVKEYKKDYMEFDWFRNELIWTYISNLKNESESSSLGSVLQVANKIMDLNPDDLPKTTTVLFVLKKAKQYKKWEIASSWVDRIDPETLDRKPISLVQGSTPWSNYLIWHHHKVRCLIHQKKYQEAIDMVRFIVNEANQVKKFFKCLEAHAYEQMGNFDEAIKILSDLNKHRNVDWWIVHQLARVLKYKGDEEIALKKMYHAATLSHKLESIVTLIYDIALLCKELNRMEESYFHLLLFKQIREKREWVVKDDIEQLIKETGILLNITNAMTFKEVTLKCREYWNAEGIHIKQIKKGSLKRKTRTALVGSLIKVKEDKPFCFIKTSEDTFFCNKSNIKGEVKEGMKVQFDAIPSFDKKKQQESWKAINIVLI